MATLLFNITPHDPATYISVVGTLVAVAMLACYVPARRVLRVDPAIALKDRVTETVAFADHGPL